VQQKILFSIGQGDSEPMHTLSNKVALKSGRRSKSEKGLSTDSTRVGLQISHVHQQQTKSWLYWGSPHRCSWLSCKNRPHNNVFDNVSQHKCFTEASFVA